MLVESLPALALFSDAIVKSAQQVKGTISCDSQYHFHMETQVLKFYMYAIFYKVES